MLDTLSHDPIPAVEAVVAEPLDIQQVALHYRLMKLKVGGLWGAHHDQYFPSNLANEDIISDHTVEECSKIEQGLAVLERAHQELDTEQYPWLPDREDLLQLAVGGAEWMRRSISTDSYAISNSVSDQSRIEGLDIDERRYARALARISLGGFHVSVADSRVKEAERREVFNELTPLDSQREYQEITPLDVSASLTESPNKFASIAADLLSPIRNEHLQTSEEVIGQIAKALSERHEEIGPLFTPLILSSWRLAKLNKYGDLAANIVVFVPENTPLRRILESYKPKATEAPSDELLKANRTRIVDEYLAADGDPAALEAAANQPQNVRIRLTPESLWGIALRDNGLIRSGDEGTVRGGSRGAGEPSYRIRREQVEEVMFGPVADDILDTKPIIYGYYASQEELNLKSMHRMPATYGEVELVLKPDIQVETRAIYGDSLNAVAMGDPKETFDEDIVRSVIESRMVPPEDGEAMAFIINALHGHEENRFGRISSNPYVECVMRGRLTLADCSEIHVPRRLTETRDGQAMIAKIEELYGVKVVAK